MVTNSPKAVRTVLMVGGLLISMQTLPVMAEENEKTGSEGELIFALCNDYINIRENASVDSEITAKIYHYGSAVIEKVEGDWYKIQSGNAVGYVKTEYFATGQQAEEIASEVAYNVAIVHPEFLNVRSGPSDADEVIAAASHNDELEVVDYDGDWMKVALGDDVYGYVNAYYVDYHTYYPTAETLEEEQARLKREAEERENSEEQEEWSDASGEDKTEDSWTENTSVNTDVSQENGNTAGNEAGTETESSATAEGTEETSPAEADASEDYYEDVSEDDSYSDGSGDVEEVEDAEEVEYVDDYKEASEAPAETEVQYQETEAVYDETEAAYQETEPAAESYTSGTGQQIADYAVQFVGNPYQWGGTSLTSGADCSGFTYSVFANFGIGLARTADSQAYGGTAVSLDSIQPGDLLFYNSTGSIDHVAIYIGGGQIVHAANANSGITISGAYYSTPVSACRYW